MSTTDEVAKLQANKSWLDLYLPSCATNASIMLPVPDSLMADTSSSSLLNLVLEDDMHLQVTQRTSNYPKLW
jgi:hypothetical protein